MNYKTTILNLLLPKNINHIINTLREDFLEASYVLQGGSLVFEYKKRADTNKLNIDDGNISEVVYFLEKDKGEISIMALAKGGRISEILVTENTQPVNRQIDFEKLKYKQVEKFGLAESTNKSSQ